MITATIEGTLPQINLDFTEKYRQIAELMKKSIQLNFTEGGRPEPWAPRKYDLFGNPLLFGSGALFSSIYSDSGPDFAEAGAKNTVHQEGATFTVPITERSRGFFWVMWYNTGDEMWKWMALTQRAVFVINIPGRPYVMFQKEDIEKYMEILGTGLFTLTDASGKSAKITIQ